MILKTTPKASLLAVLLVVSAAATAQAGAYEEQLEEAELLVQERNYKDAIKAFKKAQKLAGEPTFECCHGLANTFVNLGAYKNAVDSARQALPLADGKAARLQAYNLLGLALFADGNSGTEQLREAAAAFEALLELTAELPPEQRASTHLARFNLGVTLLKLERDEEGVAMLREFLAGATAGPELELARTYVDNPLRARVPLMPELEVVTLDGEYLTSEDLLGKVVLIDFWGTWCAPCIASLPHLERLSRRSEKSPFVLLSISNDSDGGLLRRFVAEHRMTWPQVWDEDTELTRVVFKISRYPTFLLVDHEGEIIYRQSGWGDGIQRDLDSRVARAIRAAKKAGAR